MTMSRTSVSVDVGSREHAMASPPLASSASSRDSTWRDLPRPAAMRGSSPMLSSYQPAGPGRAGLHRRVPQRFGRLHRTPDPGPTPWSDEPPAFSLDGERCNQTEFDMTGEWSHVVLGDLASSCAALGQIGGMTIDMGEGTHTAMYLDNVRFIP